MKLPRDLSGAEVARWLARHCGCRVTGNPQAQARFEQNRFTVVRQAGR